MMGCHYDTVTRVEIFPDEDRLAREPYYDGSDCLIACPACGQRVMYK